MRWNGLTTSRRSFIQFFVFGIIFFLGWYSVSLGALYTLMDVVSDRNPASYPAASATDAATSSIPASPFRYIGAKDMPALDKLIVVAHYHENLEWTEEIDIPVKLVEKDNPNNPDNLNLNNMTESTSYLYYMIKYYNSLPRVTAFVHGHGDAQLQNESTWTINQYQPLHHPEYMVSCNTRHKEERGWLIWFGDADAQPAPSEDPSHVGGSPQYVRAFHDLFDFLRLETSKGGMGMVLPHFISTPCCSAFSVDRDTIRQVPHDRLVRLFDYLEAGTNLLHGNAMEYVWTVLFNQDDWT